MRIVSGHARGLKLLAPGAGVRPTTDRVKESMFAMLEPLVGLTVVDLFAGSGALGLEALSRGAAAVYFVEQRRQQCELIRRNAARVAGSLPDTAVNWQIIQSDVRRLPGRLAGISPDIVVADPPYKPGPGEAGAEAVLTPAIGAWLGAGLLVLEQSARGGLPPENLLAWRLVTRRVHGDSAIYFLRWGAP